MAPKKILLVDDEEDIRFTLGRRFKAAGYQVETAADGAEALAKVRSALPDLIVLDVMMPELNGYQVCRAVRQDPATRNIPVIMLTAKAQEADKFWGEEVGATVYLTKPFDDQDLLKRVAEILG